jgi:hypothetical protein
MASSASFGSRWRAAFQGASGSRICEANATATIIFLAVVAVASAAAVVPVVALAASVCWLSTSLVRGQFDRSESSVSLDVVEFC